MKRFTQVLTLAMAALSLSLATFAPAHANPGNGNAAHGVAHALYELADDEAGIGFLEHFLADYPRDAAMHCHLSWHLALVALRNQLPRPFPFAGAAQIIPSGSNSAKAVLA